MPNPFLPQQSASVAPGQTSVCRVDGETFRGPGVTPDPTRRLLVDATGLYLLHSDSNDTNPPLSLHLNQAGWALVGWIAPTAHFVPSKASLPEGSVLSAVLVADLDPGATEPLPNADGTTGPKTGSRLVCKDVDKIDSHDPSDVLDPAQPFLRKVPLTATFGSDTANGWISLEQIAAAGSDHWQEIVPKLRATVALTRRVGAETTIQTLVFDMADPEARVSERTIGDQEPVLKKYLSAYNRDIIPPSFFDTNSPSGATWKAAVDLFASGGPLELAIQEYWKNVDQPAAVRQPIVVKIAKLVSDAVSAWQSEDPDDARHVILNAKLLRQADRTLAVTDFGNSTWATRLLSKIGKQMLISQWLSAISAAEKSQVDTDSSPNSAPAPGAVPSLQVVPKELMWLNNSQSFETYRYTFKFGPLSPSDLAALKKYIESLPKELQKLIPSVPNASKAPAKWALLAMGVFKITISAETSSQLGVGPMANTSFAPLWGERTLFGVFGEVGVGLNDLPGLPDKMQIVSPFKVNADAFENALFEIKGAGASAGVNVPFVQGTDVGVTVRRMSFTLTDGTLLEGDLPEGKFIPDPVVGLSGSDPKKIKELAKARSRKDLANDLWSAGIGATYCMGKLVVGRPSPEHWISPPKERTATGGDNRTVASFFKVDSGDINTDLNGWSRRFLLESVLAIDLYLFNGAPGISVIGHASPEGTPRHNLILSRLRADVVTQAILDAIVIDSAFIIPAGAGDELARRTPVDPALDPNDPKSKGAKTFDEPDPDGNTNKRDEFAKAHTEQSSRWPEFRKVVIEWWGQFFIKVETTGEKSDQDAPEQQPDATPPQDSAPPQGPPSQQPPPGHPTPAPAPTDIA